MSETAGYLESDPELQASLETTMADIRMQRCEHLSRLLGVSVRSVSLPVGHAVIALDDLERLAERLHD